MKPIEFWKMSGSGNDFILIDNRDEGIREEEMGRLVARACRRRESVGADGLIFVIKSTKYDFGWRYFNADGGRWKCAVTGAVVCPRFRPFLKFTNYHGNNIRSARSSLCFKYQTQPNSDK